MTQYQVGGGALLNIYLINKGVVMGVVVGVASYKEIYDKFPYKAKYLYLFFGGGPGGGGGGGGGD